MILPWINYYILAASPSPCQLPSFPSYLLAFSCTKSFTFSPLIYLWFYQFGLGYLYSIRWVIIQPCLSYHAHIDPIVFILKMTSLGWWAGMGWCHVHLVPYCLRKKSFNTFFSFSWEQLSIHLLWPGQLPSIQTQLPLSNRMEGATVLPVKVLRGLRQTQVSSLRAS